MSAQSILFRDVCVEDPRGCGSLRGDVLVRSGAVAQIRRTDDREDEDRSSDDETMVIDCSGMLLFPGLIDAHVHFRDPGYTDKEDVSTGAAAAKHGGFTSVIMMGNTAPHPDTAERVREAAARGSATGIHVYTCGNVTVGMKGAELTDFAALKEAGAVLLSDDGLPILDADVMERACAKAAETGMVISLHEEDRAYIREPGVNRGAAARSMGLEGADRMAEITMVKRDIGIAEWTGAQITIQHISAGESVELVRSAGRRGIKVHAEATPHHFTLTEDAVLRYGTNAKMNPPLREERDRLAIIEGLRDGCIDMIATDHAPHTSDEKSREFVKAPSGITGLETALSLAFRELVMPGYLTWQQVITRMTEAYEVYGLPGGEIKEGAAADLVLFDPKAVWKADSFCSKAMNTPFRDEELPGKVMMTVCGGRIVYEDGKGCL